MSEAVEQETLFDWIHIKRIKWPELDLAWHTPNGGSRNKVEAARLKAQGVKKGVPDVFLAIPKNGYHGLFIEMKRTQGGKVSPEQETMLQRLNEQGYKAVVCKGWQAAARMIEDYMTGRLACGEGDGAFTAGNR